MKRTRSATKRDVSPTPPTEQELEEPEAKRPRRSIFDRSEDPEAKRPRRSIFDRKEPNAVVAVQRKLTFQEEYKCPDCNFTTKNFSWVNRHKNTHKDKEGDDGGQVSEGL